MAAESLPSATGSLIQMLLGLGLTLALLIGGLKLLKRLQGTHASQPGALRVISAASVGPRERVVLVAVGKQVLVLGVAPGRVAALHTLPAEELPAAEEPAPLVPPMASDFAARLKQMLEHRREK